MTMFTFRKSIKMFWWRRRSRKQALLRRLNVVKTEVRENFGDVLGPLLVSTLSGQDVRHSRGAGKLLTVGSIFFALKRGDTVWGSGMIHEGDVTRAAAARDFLVLAVRGPRTRDTLVKAGFDCPAVFGDPALLVPHVFDLAGGTRRGVGFVPHWTQLERFKEEVSKLPEGAPIKLIDVTGDCAEVLSAIAGCEYVVSSSLHGVIVADALGVPALPVIYGKLLHDDPFKFEDYMYSTDRAYRPVMLQFPLNVDALAARADAVPKPRIDLLPLLRSFPFRQFASLEHVARRPLFHGHVSGGGQWSGVSVQRTSAG